MPHPVGRGRKTTVPNARPHLVNPGAAGMAARVCADGMTAILFGPAVAGGSCVNRARGSRGLKWCVARICPRPITGRSLRAAPRQGHAGEATDAEEPVGGHAQTSGECLRLRGDSQSASRASWSKTPRRRACPPPAHQSGTAPTAPCSPRIPPISRSEASSGMTSAQAGWADPEARAGCSPPPKACCSQSTIGEAM